MITTIVENFIYGRGLSWLWSRSDEAPCLPHGHSASSCTQEASFKHKTFGTLLPPTLFRVDMHRPPFYVMLPRWLGVRQILSSHFHCLITLTVPWQKNNDGCTNYGGGRVAEFGPRLYAAADCRSSTYRSSHVPLCVPYTTAGYLVTRHHPQSTSHLIAFYVDSHFS
jgi:hypothetical protein